MLAPYGGAFINCLAACPTGFSAQRWAQFLVWGASLGTAAALVLGAIPARAHDSLPVQPVWAELLQAELSLVAGRHTAGLGVYVRDLETGVAVSHHGNERWYLASTVKVPVALAVLQAVERGDFTLDTQLRVRAADYVDGAGHTNSKSVGASLSVRYLLEQMIIHSDNTASDMLIGLVGIRAVNALVEQLVPQGIERITTLADVRRHAYGYLTPEAAHLTGNDFLALKKQPNDAERLQTLARLLHVPAASFQRASVAEAFEAYYDSGLNSGRLDAYANLLHQVVDGQVLNAAHTRYLLRVMERVQTGARRIKAGLPATARFAHKTGTQRARTCDAGLISVPRLGGLDRRVVVVACTRGELLTARSDRALQDVGAAICKSGLLTDGRPHDPLCLPAAHPVSRAGAHNR
ncbi:MAG: class A beta-lactamase-related serine hydrolase [Gammaproteobacteria bacterium]|nr:class A beta-lactamase-related serine hydrolase [Gammaproteobacteria bacterium]MBU1507578.1 class A beta-lactamase-related serine hydrolase [Gammaproteobacteria bacterium]MBU2119303.1 class A beta-lactamase-related serine hydrolase [Gammaproteobacteria bacterium]MBU2172425.1 class A beta-lactamase-related serine hydrolase [Gammaproteobacteria bacterium]MBU2200122.1 class A beta-lactamase-related serine hydrolase [Gammaproteobacteria bacterium]